MLTRQLKTVVGRLVEVSAIWGDVLGNVPVGAQITEFGGAILRGRVRPYPNDAERVDVRVKLTAKMVDGLDGVGDGDVSRLIKQDLHYISLGR